MAMSKGVPAFMIFIIAMVITVNGSRRSTDGLGSQENGTRTQRSFLNDLLDNYDINDWPNASDSQPTIITVQMFINSFGSLNAANMDYSIDVFLRQRWRDPRLVFGKDSRRERVTVTDPKMQAKIWKPDTFFNNVKDAEIHVVTMPNVLLRINKHGDVLYSMRITLKLSCHLQLEHFPFDAQTCHTALASYANTDEVIIYRWEDENPIDFPDNLEIAQFDLIHSNTAESLQQFVTGNFSALIADFYLRRQNGYHVLQSYVPTILIVAISWVSFWLDPNAVPGRVSLGVTTLLTLTTLASGIRQQLPPVSYVKAIDVWVGMCMIMVFGALLEFTFVNWLANKKVVSQQTMFKIPKLLSIHLSEPSRGKEHMTLAGTDEEVGFARDVEKGEDENEEEEEEEGKEEKEKEMDAEFGQAEAGTSNEPAKPPKTYLNYARALDRLCRAMFPGAFLLFNLIYWPYYLIHQRQDPGFPVSSSA